MVCVPRDNPAVLRLACPDKFNLTDPRLEDPLRNVTVPVGVPAEAVTVAVNVTVWPLVEGLTEELSKVVVVALMICASDDDVLDKNRVSPL